MAVGAGWALAWLVTANVIVDADRGYVVFGSSGALAMTALVGLVLVWIVRRPTIGEMREPSDRVAASGGAS